ncbi:Guanylyl cyclase-activating protein 3 [Myotis brandtii]|uniref:Guanylyl cyclase-activating protein 3 n=1 Tax=Myotis brandtii TaxID=109478 RepID=S7MCJ6_MYOBR|nr:Guanylyl cyclase-activating protein 3 [Myotis brandtii]
MGHSTSIAEGLTAIPAEETYVWYRKCMMEYPSGLQTLHEFKTLLGLQGLGFIDFLEFIAAVNLVVRGKLGQKLKRYFKLYDADGNGSIDKKELLNIFMVNCTALNGQQTLSPEEFTNLVFHKIDINHDGRLRTTALEEFISGTEKDQDLLEVVSESFDFSNVLTVTCNGKQADTGGGFLQTI